MSQFQKPLYKSKTFWTGIGSIVGGIQAFVTGTPDVNTAIMLVVAGLMAIFLRDGIKASGPV